MEEQKAYSQELKAEAMRRMQAGESPTALARELGVARKRLYKWKDRVLAGKPLRARGRPKGSSNPPRQVDTAAGRIAELERLVGRLTMENDFFKGALRRIEEIRRANNEAGVAASSHKSKR